MRRTETPEGRSVRLLRVGEQVRHILSELLQRGDVHDDVLQSHLVSITEVRMSPDLRHATVFVKPLLGQDEEAVLKALRQNTAYLQREVADRNKVEFRYYDVIYHLTDWVKGAMAGELGPEIIETVVGRARVQEVFPAGKKDKAAGLLVLEGVIRKGLNARLTREDVIVSATTISSLRRFKDDVAEVTSGLECGVMLADTNDIKAGDNLEVFEVEERARTL